MQKYFAGLVILLVIGAALFVGWRSLNRRPNIVFVLCDTLRADHLGVYGYERPTSPNIDKFAKQALLYASALSAAPWTPPSIGSLFTGMIPSVHGMNPPNKRALAKKLAMRLNEEYKTLPELLMEQGYQTVSVSASPWFSAPFGFLQGFARETLVMRSSAEKINALAFEALSEFKKSAKPFFLYLHYMDVHKRGDNPLAPYDKFPAQVLKRWDYAPDILEQIALYDAELNYFDARFGELLDYLKREDLYDNTVIVLVSDHGEQFRERGKLGHGYNLFLEELHVPLILRVPGRDAERIEELVSSRDLFFTLLELTGIKMQLRDGDASLLDPARRAKRNGIISEGTRFKTSKGYTASDLKRLILYLEGVSPHQQVDSLRPASLVGLFDPKADPREQNAIKEGALVDERRQQFEDYYENAVKGRKAPQRVDLNEDTLKDLESLGYLN